MPLPGGGNRMDWGSGVLQAESYAQRDLVQLWQVA